MTLSPPIVRRLALVKFMFREGLEQSRRPSPAFVGGLLTFHDAVELFLHLACDHHGVLLKPRAAFDDYFSALCEKCGPVAHKITMMKLNEARRNLKHHGNLPHAEDIESFRFTLQAFFDENTPALFGVSFADISLIDMVACAKAREHLASAEQHWKGGRPRDASGDLALAYHELHWDYMERNREPLARRTPFDFGPSLSFMSGSRLGLERDARRFVDDVLESIKRMRSALEVMALGIDYKKYVEFDMLTPSVQRYASGRTEVVNWASRELTQEEHERCFSFVIEAALKLQEFDFAFAAERAERGPR